MEVPKTPENAPRIPKDDSFKTCKQSPTVHRKLRATPARLSILSGGKPFRETPGSRKKFNSRRKNGTHNDTAGSNETFIRHEQDLLYDRDSLDPGQQIPQHFIDNVTKQVIAPRTSSPKFASIEPARDLSPIHASPRRTSPQKSSPKKASPKKSLAKYPSPKKSLARNPSPKKSSPSKVQATRVLTRPVPKPRPMLAPKPRSTPAPPLQWNRYMSSTAKKPTATSNDLFKKPTSVMMDSSVASSRRCLAQWNTPRITRTQSFKSTAELERDYFTSLRSSRS